MRCHDETAQRRLTCKDCSNGEVHGLPPSDAPEWDVGSIYFWCPIGKHHDVYGRTCQSFERGVTKRFDRHGRPLG